MGEFVHGFAQHPKDKNQILCFSKLKKKGFHYNVLNREFKPFNSAEGNLFYGHGTYSMEGDFFFSIEASDQNSSSYRKEGEIVKRDSRSLEIISRHPTFGNDPHDAFMLDPKTLVVANGAKQNSSVTFIDIESMKLKEKVVLKNKNQTARHLLHDKDQNILLVLLSRKDDVIKEPIPLTYLDLNQKKPQFNYFTMGQPQDLPHSQHVSIAIGGRYAITTLMDQDMIAIWDRFKKELVKTIKIKGASYINYFDQKEKFLLGTLSGQAYTIEKSSLKVEEISPDLKLNGAHSIIIHDRPLRANFS